MASAPCPEEFDYITLREAVVSGSIALVSGSQTRVGQFLTALANGFVQTRLEILLLFLFVIVLLLAFSLYFVAQKRAAYRMLASHSREMLEHRLGELDLDDEETALLGRLARYRERWDSEHALLVSHHVFDSCARKLRQSEGVSEARLNALRLKVGYRMTSPEDVPASSTELPEGSPLLVVAGTAFRLRGTLIAQGPGSMIVKLDPEASPPPKGIRLTLYFHNSAGIFSFPTRVTDVLEDAVHLEHSTDISHYQRRKYYRRKEFLPVFVKPASASASPRESFLLDLGGGGASLQAPRCSLRKGDLVEVSFSPRKGTFTLAARVLRASKGGKVIHVKFESLSETERNRIMSFLFAQSVQRAGSR